MKTIPRSILTVLAASLWVSSPSVKASDLLYSQAVDGQSAFGPSEVWAPSNIDSEVADDFDVVGSIDRVIANGFVSGSPIFQGVNVRFYEYLADGTPGPLQQEYVLSTGYNAGTIDVTLSPPFVATGKHFLTIQPALDGWYWWSANTNIPEGTAFYLRDVAAGETEWHHDDSAFYPNSDVSFYLYGTTSGPGNITALSATTLERSGYLEITGTNFGSDATVLIDGVSAPVADWLSTKIVCYVPESTRLATVPVQVVNTSGLPSNTMNLTVTARQAAGKVDWRFRQNGPYSIVRPVIGPDGTVYSIDVFFHLYALTPDGGLKWLVRGAGNKGVAVGADGVIYVGSESDIKAYNSDGTLKWTFVQNPRAFILVGLSVGPDGNIYAVATQGMGVFSLTPSGTLRWQTPEAYARLIVDYGEIVFGQNGSTQQLYFYANNHLRALKLDGTSVFTITGTFGQPAVAPDGSIHNSFSAYSPAGSLLWTFHSPYSYNLSSPPDIGSDGTHYFVQNTAEEFALNTSGSQKWHLTLMDYVQGPIVDPQNTQLILGSATTLNNPGYIISTSAQDGHELWRVNLPAEVGFNQSTDTRARFVPDGLTAYIITYTATGDNNTSRSFLYSLDTATEGSPTPTPTPAATLRSTSITLTAKGSATVTVTAKITVQDSTGKGVSGVVAAVTWQLPGGNTSPQIASTNRTGLASFKVAGTRGTYTVTVTNLTKAGYVFDPANSVLTKRITR